MRIADYKERTGSCVTCQASRVKYGSELRDTWDLTQDKDNRMR